MIKDYQVSSVLLISELQDLRTNKGLSRNELSYILGVKPYILSDVETFTTEPTITFVMKYAKSLGYKLKLEKIEDDQ